MEAFKGLAIWIATKKLSENRLSASHKYFLAKHSLARSDVIVKCDAHTSNVKAITFA